MYSCVYNMPASVRRRQVHLKQRTHRTKRPRYISADDALEGDWSTNEQRIQ